VYGAPDWLVAFSIVLAGAVMVGGLRQGSQSEIRTASPYASPLIIAHTEAAARSPCTWSLPTDPQRL
jgi:hypothetical protein